VGARSREALGWVRGGESRRRARSPHQHIRRGPRGRGGSSTWQSYQAAGGIYVIEVRGPGLNPAGRRFRAAGGGVCFLLEIPAFSAQNNLHGSRRGEAECHPMGRITTMKDKRAFTEGRSRAGVRRRRPPGFRRRNRWAKGKRGPKIRQRRINASPPPTTADPIRRSCPVLSGPKTVGRVDDPNFVPTGSRVSL